MKIWKYRAQQSDNDFDERVNDEIKEIEKKNKIIDIKLSSDRYDDTIMIIYESKTRLPRSRK